MRICADFDPSVPQGAQGAADTGMVEFLKNLTKQDFGFEKSDDLAAARLAPGFRLHSLDLGRLRQSRAPDLRSLVRPVGEWLFPVTIGGQYRCLLLVREEDAKHETVLLGYPELARRLQRVREAWPEAGGAEPLLVLIPELRAYFFSLSGRAESELTPLVAVPLGKRGRLEPPQDFSRLRTAAEILPLLQRAARDRE